MKLTFIAGPLLRSCDILLRGVEFRAGHYRAGVPIRAYPQKEETWRPHYVLLRYGNSQDFVERSCGAIVHLSGRWRFHLAAIGEPELPKLKTKSGAKKRFKVTTTGKVMAAHAGKRHGMIKRTKKQIRQLRGTRVLFKTDGDNIKRYFLPNA